jgi:predicted O-linked N-acetylglucosamine transferase (SPINDLY family)
MIGSADLQRKAAEIWADRKYPVTSGPLPVPEFQRHEKIRLGYFSADFHNHATTYLMAELVEKHDRNKFEVLAFSFGPDHKDEMRQRMSFAFDRFIDVESRSDIEIAQLSRSLGIDLAFDLKGYTRDSRPGIFAARAAPVQVSYLGYPGTTGSAFMDYLVADSTLIPESSRWFYSEKIIYLPRSYQPNDSRRAISMKRQVREEAGLPAAGFVYCCFNNTFKILPSVFDIWMRVLDSVNGSVLWLIADSAEASDRLRGEAVGRGVSADRLVFAERLPLPEHLARHQLADLFLDTFPCNAHTTASDALWAGLPVLTCPGETFASRVAASLLNAVDMPELIAASQQEYEDLAINLATQPERLAAIRNKLACQKPSSALFNTELYVNRFEAACSAIHERYQAGLPCEHILIE